MRGLLFILLISTPLLNSCGRSPDSEFYVLRPMLQAEQVSNKRLQIGINEVNIPAYLEKPQFAVNYSRYQLKLEEFHRWAEPLNKNIPRVIQTNLSVLLPKALVETAPWDSKFKPDLQLQITLREFTVDVNGNSFLAAEFALYRQNTLINKGKWQNRLKVQPVNAENLVASMNANLNKLSSDLAKALIKFG